MGRGSSSYRKKTVSTKSEMLWTWTTRPLDPASLIVMGCISACGVGRLHIWKKTISAERHVPLRRHVFREGMAYFSKTVLNHMLHLFQQHGFTIRVQELKWPACSPDCSPTENILKLHKMTQWAQQLESSITQNVSSHSSCDVMHGFLDSTFRSLNGSILLLLIAKYR